MPGIVGLITSLPRDRAEVQLHNMLSAIRHDPSDNAGIWIDEPLGVYVGWTQRATPFCDQMPMINERRDMLLVFSGEEYADPPVKASVHRQGDTLHSEKASYLLHCYEHDPAFPAGLNGRFQGLAIDRRGEQATLFNDRSGMHRVYYHQCKDAFYFAGEAKAILAVRPDLRQIDPRGLGEYLTCGCVLENRTLFPAVNVLPPGSAWTFRNRALEQKRTYFLPAHWEGQEELAPDTYYEALRSVFARILPRYFTGGGPIGMSVTGGLDTRMIMAWWKAPAGSVPCYSFVGTYRESQDGVLGRRLAGAWGQPHERIEIGHGFLARFPEYAYRTVFLTDGCADVSASPVLYANEQARLIAPTRMTGNYGSEVLRGNRAFKPQEPLPELFCPELSEHVNLARLTYAGLLRSHPVTFAVFKQAPWHHYGLFALEGTQLTVRSPFLDNDLVRTVYRSPVAAYADSSVCLRLIGDGNRALREVRTDRGVGRRSVTGAVMRAVLECTFKAEYAYNEGMPQWLARLDYLLSSIRLERVFLGRHKYYHFRVWYRDCLSKYVQEMLLDSLTLKRWFVNRTMLERIVAAHIKGVGNYTPSIHKVLTLELLHRGLLDSR